MALYPVCQSLGFFLLTSIYKIQLDWHFPKWFLSSVQLFSVSNSLQPHGLQHTSLPYSSPTPRACSNSCPSSRWCHPTISPSVILFSSCLQSFPASGTFPLSWLFKSNDQNTGASASTSVLPMSIQGWFPLRLTDLIMLSKGLSGIFSSTTVQRHQFFGVLPSLQSSSHNCMWTLEIPCCCYCC